MAKAASSGNYLYGFAAADRVVFPFASINLSNGLLLGLFPATTVRVRSAYILDCLIRIEAIIFDDTSYSLVLSHMSALSGENIPIERPGLDRQGYLRINTTVAKVSLPPLAQSHWVMRGSEKLETASPRQAGGLTFFGDNWESTHDSRLSGKV